MQDTKNITAGLDFKLNESAILYHCIISFINLRQEENELNDNFKLRCDNVYRKMELTGREKILRSYQLVKVDGDQA